MAQRGLIEGCGTFWTVINRQLAKPTTSSNTLPQCDEFPEDVCGYSALKAPRFLPVCALLIALALLGPQPLKFLSLPLTSWPLLTLSPQGPPDRLTPPPCLFFILSF